MHGPMSCSPGPMGHGGRGHDMVVPLIPAPAAFVAMMFGFMIGVMIGRKKKMMHGMGSHMAWGGGSWGDWAERKKMMGMTYAHHHHGEGTPPCSCGQGAPEETERADSGE